MVFYVPLHWHGVEKMLNKSQHRKWTPEKKIPLIAPAGTQTRNLSIMSLDQQAPPAPWEVAF